MGISFERPSYQPDPLRPRASGGSEHDPRFPDWFRERIVRARHLLLMLDCEAALPPPAEWAPRRPRPSAYALLQSVSLRPRTSLVLFSGRALAEIESSFGWPLRAHFVGDHGWEERRVDGRRVVRPVPGESARLLGRAARVARAAGFEDRLRRGRSVLAVETRGMPPEHAEHLTSRCRRLWNSMPHDGLRLMRTDAGLELRAFARHEATVVAERIAASPPGTLPVYVGDDRSDPDAFYQVLGRGIGVHAGAAAAEAITDLEVDGAVGVRALLELVVESGVGPR